MRKKAYKILKSTTCVLLTGAMVLTGVPEGMLFNDGTGQVYAEEYVDGESTYEYTEQWDGTVQITDYFGNDTELTIPGEIDGKKLQV